MRKSVIIGIFVLLLICSGFVFAEEANVDTNTESEAVVMHNAYGAKMRILQLQYEIERRIMWMEQVVSYLDEKGNSTSELQGIIEELKLVADESKNYDVGDLDEAVDKFIAIKQDAKALVAEFKEKARAILTDEDKNALRLKFNETNKVELDQLREQIREQRREFNAERTQAVLQAMGSENETLISQVRNEELTTAEVKQRLREDYANAGNENKLQLKDALRNELNTRVDAVRARVNAYVRDAATNAAARVQARAMSLQQVVSTYAHERANAIRNSVGGTNAN